MNTSCFRQYLASVLFAVTVVLGCVTHAVVPAPDFTKNEQYKAAYAAAFKLTAQSTDQPTIPVVMISAGSLPDAFGANAPLRLTQDNRPVVVEMLKRIVLMADDEARFKNDLNTISITMRGFAVAGDSVDDLAFVSRFFHGVSASAVDEISDLQIRALYSMESNQGGDPVGKRNAIENVQYSAMDTFVKLAMATGKQDVAVPLLSQTLESSDLKTVRAAAECLVALDTESAVQALVNRLGYLEKQFVQTWNNAKQSEPGTIAPEYNYLAPSAFVMIRGLLTTDNVLGEQEAKAALLRWKQLCYGAPQAQAILDTIGWQELWALLKDKESARLSAHTAGMASTEGHVSSKVESSHEGVSHVMSGTSPLIILVFLIVGALSIVGSALLVRLVIRK